MEEYLKKIDKSRFTDTTNVTLCGDSNNGKSLICVDLVYDSDETRCPTECDVINVYESEYTEEHQKFAEKLQESIATYFGIPKWIA